VDAAPLRLWIGAVLLVGGIAFALFQSPIVGIVVCLVGVAIFKLGPGAP
jgi:hypothetical protein